MKDAHSLALALTKVGKKFDLAPTASAAKDGRSFFWALEDISLEVPKGQILGILGRNGAGKTTLLHLMAGTLTATQGRVHCQGRAIGLFNLGVGFQDELTGRENIFLNGMLLGASGRELQAKLEQIIQFSELGDFIEMPLGTFSQGMRLRLAFGILSQLDFEILLLDEVLAVGDILFQNKCYQTLLKFKEQGKTLVVTSQSLDVMERLSDRMILLDHGKIVFSGSPQEAIARYQALMIQESFYVGVKSSKKTLYENTKKWAEDVAFWGSKTGTGEARITSVSINGHSGNGGATLACMTDLKVEVTFDCARELREIHFGVAIFREDGIYCYGPNTAMEGYGITLAKGEGQFMVRFVKMPLCPGLYKLSVAIWDKREAIPYDYHNACYEVQIKGPPCAEIFWQEYLVEKLTFFGRRFHHVKPYLEDVAAGDVARASEGFENAPAFSDVLVSVSILDRHGVVTPRVMTGGFFEILCRFQGLPEMHKNLAVWVGFYRVDGVLCHSFIAPLQRKDIRFRILKACLLPGVHQIHTAIMDRVKKTLYWYESCSSVFHMVFDRPDHGTVFLAHEWKFSLQGTVSQTTCPTSEEGFALGVGSRERTWTTELK